LGVVLKKNILRGKYMKFSEMTDKQLLDYCRERFCEYRVCEACGCEEDCVTEDCPLVQFFDRTEKMICGE
jgi:hypothetical protein